MNEITIGDKIYISAKRAAEITGYARDYVGQLCREGHVDAKMVGRSWYVNESSIRAHRFGAEAAQAQPAVAGTVAASNEQSNNTGIQVSEANDAADTANNWGSPVYTAEKPELLPEVEAPRLEELLPPAEETLTDMQEAWREWFDQRQTQLATPEIESPAVIDQRNNAYEAAHELPEASEKEVEEDDEAADDSDEESEEVEVPLHTLEEAVSEEEIASTDEEIVPIHTIRPAAQPQYSAPVAISSMDIAPAPLTPNISTRTVIPNEEIVPLQQGRIVTERIVPARSSRTAAKGKNTSTGTRSQRSNAPVVALLLAVSLVSVTVAAIGTGYAGRYLKTLPAKNNPAINFLVGTREFKR